MVMAGVAIGSALFVALTAMGAGYQEAARAPLADVAADLVLSRQDPDGAASTPQSNRGIRVPDGAATFDAGELTRISDTRDVTGVSGAVQLWDFGPRQTIVVTGVEAADTGLGPGRILHENLIEGEAFTPDQSSVAVLDRHFAAFYDLGVGSPVQVGGETFRAVGVVEIADSSQAAAANIYLPLHDAQRLGGLQTDQTNQVHVRLADAGRTDEVVADLTSQLGPVRALTENDVVQIFGAVGEISNRFATIAALVALLAGGLLAWLALRGMVSERATEIGLLRAVGWRRRDVVRSFVSESFLLSVLGAVAGLLLGIIIAKLLTNLPLPAVDLSGSAGHTSLPDLDNTTERNLPASVSVSSALIATVGAIVTGTLAGLQASAKIATIRPAQNLIGRA